MNNIITLKKISKNFLNNKKVSVLKKSISHLKKAKFILLWVHQVQANLHY